MMHNRGWNEESLSRLIASMSTVEIEDEIAEVHLTREEAFDYLCELLVPDETQRLRVHVAACKRCAAELRRIDAEAAQVDVTPVLARITTRLREERRQQKAKQQETFVEWLARIFSPRPDGIYAEGEEEDEECEIPCNLDEINVKCHKISGEIFISIEWVPDYVERYSGAVVSIPYKESGHQPLRIRIGVPEQMSQEDMRLLAFDRMQLDDYLDG